MSFFRKRLGQEGEYLAAGFLRKKGYKLVERNYRCKTGEVDLIVLDRKVVVFVEVKTRSDRRHFLARRPSGAGAYRKRF